MQTRQIADLVPPPELIETAYISSIISKAAAAAIGADIGVLFLIALLVMLANVVFESATSTEDCHMICRAIISQHSLAVHRNWQERRQ